MTEPDNIILVYLRRIDEKVDRLIEEMRNVKARLSGVEKEVASLHGAVAEINSRLDGHDLRLQRIEKRLDLHDNSFMESSEKFEGQDD